ncbi:MAG: hypothetical protein KIS91_03445 [Anaerolineae bacterium]|nr:hypothetical protein [Anaerolineae bacterium]
MDEHTSARAARLLQEQGFANVSVLLGGWRAWTKASLPVE